MIKLLALIMLSGSAAPWSTPLDFNGSSGPSVAATAIGTCADTTTLYDVNGVTFCGSLDTTDPRDGYINGADCYAHDATCTSADTIVCPPSDTKQLTGVSGAGCTVGETVSVTCDGTTTTITEGTDFSCGGTDAACATAIATALSAATSCVVATAVTTTVGAQPSQTTCEVTLAADTGCGTASNGSDGQTVIYGETRLNGVTFANLRASANGTIIYCSDCAKATPCAGAGTGALAKRLNSTWDCD